MGISLRLPSSQFAERNRKLLLKVASSGAFKTFPNVAIFDQRNGDDSGVRMAGGGGGTKLAAFGPFDIC